MALVLLDLLPYPDSAVDRLVGSPGALLALAVVLALGLAAVFRYRHRR